MLVPSYPQEEDDESCRLNAVFAATMLLASGITSFKAWVYLPETPCIGPISAESLIICSHGVEVGMQMRQSTLTFTRSLPDCKSPVQIGTARGRACRVSLDFGS